MFVLHYAKHHQNYILSFFSVVEKGKKNLCNLRDQDMQASRKNRKIGPFGFLSDLLNSFIFSVVCYYVLGRQIMLYNLFVNYPILEQTSKIFQNECMLCAVCVLGRKVPYNIPHVS